MNLEALELIFIFSNLLFAVGMSSFVQKPFSKFLIFCIFMANLSALFFVMNFTIWGNTFLFLWGIQIVFYLFLTPLNLTPRNANTLPAPILHSLWVFFACSFLGIFFYLLIYRKGSTSFQLQNTPYLENLSELLYADYSAILALIAILVLVCFLGGTIALKKE